MTNLTQPEAALLAQAWVRLCAGDARIVRAYSDAEQHHVELARDQNQGLTTHSLDILLPVLFGKAQKVVAAEALRSSSSITGTATIALRRMGLACRPNDVPMITVMMAQAAARLGAAHYPAGSLLPEIREDNCVLSVPRSEAWLSQVLTRSELRVIALRVEGYSHEQVAHVCTVSKRTVANQIASAYRKLGVSARLELLNHILAGIPTRQIFAPVPAPRVAFTAPCEAVHPTFERYQVMNQTPRRAEVLRMAH